jgi:uncharacterized membrane protein YvbJ
MIAKIIFAISSLLLATSAFFFVVVENKKVEVQRKAGYAECLGNYANGKYAIPNDDRDLSVDWFVACDRLKY